MKTTFYIIFILVFAGFLRFLYESFREQYRQKAIRRAKENVIAILANHKEDCTLDSSIREIEAETELFFTADQYIRSIRIDSREAYELQQAVEKFKQFTYSL